MENLETGKDKIKKICEILKNETLKPAQEEAQQIIEVAEQEAFQIIKDAESKARELIQQAENDIEKERELFNNSLEQAGRQSIETLRQNIEEKLFNQELVNWVDSQVSDPKVGALLIETLVNAVEKEGISADFSAAVAENIPPTKINAILAKNILSKLREKAVVVGDFRGGVKLKLHDQKITLDLSDEALNELIGRYLRKDFRKLLFK